MHYDIEYYKRIFQTLKVLLFFAAITYTQSMIQQVYEEARNLEE